LLFLPVLRGYWLGTNLLLGEKWFLSFFPLPIIALAIVTVPVLFAIQYCLACNNNNVDIEN
jgi:hypothetical protein